MWLGAVVVIWSASTLVEAIIATQTHPLFAFALLTGIPLLMVPAAFGVVAFRIGRRLVRQPAARSPAQLILGSTAAVLLWMGWNWQRWQSMEMNTSLTIVGAGPGYEASVDREQFVLLIIGMVCATGAVLMSERRPSRRQADRRSLTHRSILAALITILLITGVDVAGERWANDQQASLVAQVASQLEWTFHADSALLPAAIHRDRIWSSDEDGNIYAVDRRSGRGRLVTRVPGVSTRWGLVATRRSLYAVTHSTIVSLDRSGRKRWTYSVTDAESGPSSINGRPTVGSGVVVAATHAARLLSAIDEDTGRLRWRTAASNDDLFFSPSFGEPVATKLGIIVGTDDGMLRALHASNGAPRWSTKLDGWTRSAPVVSGDSVYVTTDIGHLYRVDLRSGGVRWSAFDVADSSRIAIAGRHVLLVTGDALRSFRIDTGRRAWVFGRANEGISAVATTETTIVAASHHGILYELEPTSGISISCIGLPVTWAPSASIVLDGRRPIVTAGKTITAIDHPWRFTDDFLQRYRTRTLHREECPRIRPTPATI